MTGIDDFLVQQPLAVTTRARYRWFLVRLLAWLEAQRIEPAAMSGPELVRWLDEHPTWGDASRHLAVNAVKRWIRWSFGDEHPALKVRVRVEEAPPQRTLSRDEVTRLLAALDVEDPAEPQSVKQVRDAALVSLLLDTGIRASEVCRLELQHLNLAERKVSVRIKGGRWGDGYYSVATRVRLRYWLYLRPRLARPGAETVFVSIGGERRGTTLTPDGLRAIFRQMAAALGMRHFSPHSLRRSMACICLENGASSRVVQLAGRWRSISMVETYSRALSGQVVDAYLPTATAAPPVFSGGALRPAAGVVLEAG